MKEQKKGISLIVLIIVIIVMLILSSAIIVSLSNSGIIGSARNAVAKMDKAQITQMAELLKGEYLADIASRKTTKSKQGLKEKLIAGFEVTKDTNGDDIIEVNDKWAVWIKNTDLDIEVVEITAELKASSLTSLTYTTETFEEEGKMYFTDVKFSIARLMDMETYSKLKGDIEISDAEKEQIVVKYLSSEAVYGESFESIDEAVVYDIVGNGYGDFTTIEECLADEGVQLDYGTTKEQLYYAFCTYEYSTRNEYTKGQLIDFWYDDYVLNSNAPEYNLKTKDLSLYVKRTGGTEILIQDDIDLTDEPTEVSYRINQNGTYIFILKNNKGEEITTESITINNLEKENPYYITEEEASGVWITNGSGTVTGYNGKDAKVVVPMTIGEEIITIINVNTFKGNTEITEVTIPTGVTSIDRAAFYDCTSLTKVKIPEGVTYIPKELFYNCTSLKEVTLPDTVTTIDNAAFNSCSALTKITLPTSLQTIGASAFYKCEALTRVDIPADVTSIGSFAFNGCINLGTISLSSSLTTIGGSAFRECSKLTQIALPDNLQTIGTSTFKDCTGLTKILLPEGITIIPQNAFQNCSALTSITIQGDITEIGEAAFQNCTALTNITIPEKLTTLQKSTFSGCSSLTEITIPNAVTTIEDSVFKSCKGLTKVTIGTGIETIGQSVFASCTNLTNIHFNSTTIPEGQPWGAPNTALQITP